MKIKSFLAATLAATMLLASCSKEEDANNIDGNNAGEKSFFIKIGKPGTKSRAEGPNVAEGSSVEFKDGYLIFATGDNIGRVVKIVNTTPANEDEIDVTSLERGTGIGQIPGTTNRVYLYGNLGTSLGSASGIGAKAVKGGSIIDIETNLTWELADIQNAANNVDKVPVFGRGNVAAGAVTGNAERLESKFDVAPIAARLQIGEISCTDPNVSELKLAGIYINGYYHSMDAGKTFDPSYIIDNSINVSKYPLGGYASPYEKMSDIIAGQHDLKGGAAKPVADVWAYNIFPAQMPHIVLHFATLKTNDEAALDVTNKYATVAKYSTAQNGGSGNEFTTAVAGNVYTLNINISDYTKQIDELPEANTSVMGYVEVEVISWKATTLYPEW